MDLRIVAIGRIGKGAAADLVAEYLKRSQRLIRTAGIGAITIHEIDERKLHGAPAEHQALRAALAAERYWALDERGQIQSSPEFSQNLINAAMRGNDRLNLVIGGADGLDDGLRAKAEAQISFGKMVWPHMLVRVMLFEQIYRALSIHSGLPYHRQ